jgi:sulfatase modifying factor 1
MSPDQMTGRAGSKMVRLPGGRFRMGSDRHYPEEKPQRRASVDPFWIDVTPVTNAHFSAFVRATGHQTLAERAPTASAYPGADPGMLRAGSAVFIAPEGPVDLKGPNIWWQYVFGASWRFPEGPGSSIADRMDHPVVHVAHTDAEAYARWVGKALPTEAEWEYACRGGRAALEYAWGGELAPKGAMLANYWQGQFPWQNLATDGYAGSSPVGAFPPNGFGLYDMIGNVWEWTGDVYTEGRQHSAPSGCCHQSNGPARWVIKGGSFLCAENHCRRYRPAARQAHSADTSTSNVGFRCVVR